MRDFSLWVFKEVSVFLLRTAHIESTITWTISQSSHLDGSGFPDERLAEIIKMGSFNFIDKLLMIMVVDTPWLTYLILNYLSVRLSKFDCMFCNNFHCMVIMTNEKTRRSMVHITWCISYTLCNTVYAPNSMVEVW